MLNINIKKILDTVFITSIIPGAIVLLWLVDLIVLSTLKICLLCCFVIFIVLPIIFKHCVSLQRGILFLTFITYPRNLDLTKPEKSGLPATRNFFITHRDEEDNRDVKIGLWHVLPGHLVRRFSEKFDLDNLELDNIDDKDTNTSQLLDNERFDVIAKNRKFANGINSANEMDFYEEMLRTTPGKVALYLHGNTASRGASHRVELYIVLRRLGFHVIAMDYRGYGDSEAITTTEEGVVRDAIAVYNYISNITGSPVLLWGHSLGTGVATHMLAVLHAQRSAGPRALILESPFNNIGDEIREHPFSQLFRHLPWFNYLIARPMHANKLRFESDEHVAEFRQPILILHATDDLVVPFKLGYKLYRKALDTRGKHFGPIEFRPFEASKHYGHKYICRAPELPDIVNRFFEQYKSTVF